MRKQTLELLQKALILSEEERTELVRALIETLENDSDKGAKFSWDEEISQCIADLDSGREKTIPREEIRQRISARLSHER